MKELTTTSYALLGLLALRSWSAYELAGQMRRSMAFIWPRAERAIYAEPKNLVAHGLARSRTERTGRRERTVYTITAKGRRALAAWLDEPSSPPAFESEALVRSTFAEFGTREGLLATLADLRAHAEGLEAQAMEVARSYVEGRSPFPERQHIVVLNGRFIFDYTALVIAWTQWAEAEVARWADVTDPASFPDAVDVFAALLADRERARAVRGTPAES